MKAATHFFRVSKPQIIVCFLKHPITFDVETKTSMPPTGMLSESTHLCFEPTSFDIKLKKLSAFWNLYQSSKAFVKQTGVIPNKCI
mmetsp:Transcript_24736/g.47039  ORF Transcript_24736/g.47039 Transcript_24736/m.47039 type:complete len:86 (-) Transcript_24736:328-585(-)